MKKIIFLLPVIFAFSCSSLKVMTDFDPTIDFSSYKSLEYYGWAENSDKILNRFDKERIEKSFAHEFKRRGIDIVEKGQGDMVVSLYIVTEQKTSTTAHTNHYGGYGYGGYYGYGPGWGWGGGHSTTTYSQYDYIEGTLIVSVFDAKKKELIWEAVGRGTVDENRKHADQKIARTVEKIMYKYPVRPTK